MKEKSIICAHYICEHSCELGRDAVWKKACQVCQSYKKKKNSSPIKLDKRRLKLEKAVKHDNKLD